MQKNLKIKKVTLPKTKDFYIFVTYPYDKKTPNIMCVSSSSEGAGSEVDVYKIKIPYNK